MLVYAVTEGQKPTYSAAAPSIALAAAATDVCTLQGSDTKTIRLVRLEVSGTQTTGGVVEVRLVRRTTADTGGTGLSTGAVAHDSSDAAATAAALRYTANPSGLGTLGGTLRITPLFMPATTAQPQLLIWDFGSGNDRAAVLRGSAQFYALNLNGATVTGGSLYCRFTWIEE